MQLLSEELLRVIPLLYSLKNEADPVYRVKFFMPDGGFTRYIIEGATRAQAVRVRSASRLADSLGMHPYVAERDPCAAAADTAFRALRHDHGWWARGTICGFGLKTGLGLHDW